ncbi:MAG: glycosyltransferase family protein [Chlamydiia bacterium]|nr:glycosyltransferase family protein [Chlamydiia bacterium]
MRTVIIIQARMGSTRLPGKVLLPVLGRPLLSYLIERLRRVKRADSIVIATSTEEADLALVDFAVQHQIPVFRGSENDVLSRYYDAAVANEADVIVRVTADCPVIDPAVIDAAIEAYQTHPACDYLSNTQQRSYPRGMDVEVFSLQALREAHEMAVRWPEREHVTPFIYSRPDRYRIAQLKQERNDSALRWTVDTPEDFRLIDIILSELYPEKSDFTLGDMLDLVRRQPELKTLNQHIEQKAG